MSARGKILPVAAVLVAALAASSAIGQSAERLPEDLEGVGVTQKLDAELPLDLRFKDERGNAVRLGDYFEDGKPVILSLVYYRCPMLCTLVLDGMVDALREIDWLPGEEFRIVTVSIDPAEGHQLAQLKKQNYLASYGRREAASGWHFLTGEPDAIESLADAVGFRYEYVEERGEFAHPATLFMLTPEGRISRYLFGIRHDPRTVRLSLVEAGEGKIGSLVDQFLLYCYQYDAIEGRYTPIAWRIMRTGGIITMLLLGAVLLTFWMREMRTRQKRLA